MPCPHARGNCCAVWGVPWWAVQGSFVGSHQWLAWWWRRNSITCCQHTSRHQASASPWLLGRTIGRSGLEGGTRWHVVSCQRRHNVTGWRIMLVVVVNGSRASPRQCLPAPRLEEPRSAVCARQASEIIGSVRRYGSAPPIGVRSGHQMPNCPGTRRPG